MILTPGHIYEHTPDWIQYTECAIALVPELLLLLFASRIVTWFNQRATGRITVNLVRLVAIFGALTVAAAAWTVHFHMAEHSKYGSY